MVARKAQSEANAAPSNTIAARLARDFPKTTFILQHAGMLEDLSDDGRARWRSSLAKLAAAGETKAMPALLDRLEDAALNQFPMYAELAATAVTPTE